MMDLHGKNIFSNPILVASILDGASSQQLLALRRVCKLWRDEANRLIRHRQKQFFFSPTSKTKSTAGYNDIKWAKSWENVVQLSFIYSPARKTFVRASRRLIYTTHPRIHFEAAASSAHPHEQLVESALYREIEDLYQGRLPRTDDSWNNHTLNCKMAGYTLDQFSDFLENGKSGIMESGNLDDSDDLDDSLIFAHSSFRFECGRLWDRPEISRFFRIFGPKIRYMTVNFNHMHKGEVQTRAWGEEGEVPWYMDNKWDHSYQVFKLVPNLQVLTLMLRSRWFDKFSHRISCIFLRPVFNQPLTTHRVSMLVNGAQGECNNGEPLGHLKCLRIQGIDNYMNPGHFVGWILLRAKSVERVVFEKGLSPSFLPFLGEVNFNLDGFRPGISLTRLPRHLQIICPITTLCLDLVESFQALEYIAQVIDLQHQHFGRGQRLKTLHLYLTTKYIRISQIPPAHVWGEGGPYKSPIVPPLLRILRAVADSLETLSLVGAAGVFLEGLLQNIQNSVYYYEEPRLHNFPRVHTLLLCCEQVESFKRRDFRWRPEVNRGDIQSSNTTLSKVFPRVAELHLDHHYCHFIRAGTYAQWACFLPRPDLYNRESRRRQLLGLGPCQSQGQHQVDEVKSVKKIYFGDIYFRWAFDVWKFSNVETLCLEYYPLSQISETIWSLTSLQTLIIKSIYVEVAAENFALEALLTGLSREVHTQNIKDLERSISTLPQGERENFLREKRANFMSQLNAPSILDLGRLRSLKLCFEFYPRNLNGQVKPIFSPMVGPLLLDQLPPDGHITIWAMCYESSLRENKAQNLPEGILHKAVGRTVSSHPRVSMRTVGNWGDILAPEDFY